MILDFGDYYCSIGSTLSYPTNDFLKSARSQDLKKIQECDVTVIQECDVTVIQESDVTVILFIARIEFFRCVD